MTKLLGTCSLYIPPQDSCNFQHLMLLAAEAWPPLLCKPSVKRLQEEDISVIYKEPPILMQQMEMLRVVSQQALINFQK